MLITKAFGHFIKFKLLLFKELNFYYLTSNIYKREAFKTSLSPYVTVYIQTTTFRYKRKIQSNLT